MGRKRRHAKDPTDNYTSAQQRPDGESEGQIDSAAIAKWCLAIECDRSKFLQGCSLEFLHIPVAPREGFFWS